MADPNQTAAPAPAEAQAPAEPEAAPERKPCYPSRADIENAPRPAWLEPYPPNIPETGNEDEDPESGEAAGAGPSGNPDTAPQVNGPEATTPQATTPQTATHQGGQIDEPDTGDSQ